MSTKQERAAARAAASAAAAEPAEIQTLQNAHAALNDPNQSRNIGESEYFAREVARREARAKLHAETPVQTLQLRAQPGASHLGVIIQNAEGKSRVHPLSDWRTDLIPLHAGETATIVVLVGEELETYLSFARREQAEKDQPAQSAMVGGDPVGEGSGGITGAGA